MRATPTKMFLMNLEGSLPEDSMYFIPKAEALAHLKDATGQDFGFDVQAWKTWLREQRGTKRKGAS
jgi:hypothetical protein